MPKPSYREEIARRALADETNAEIAARFGLTIRSVTRALTAILSESERKRLARDRGHRLRMPVARRAEILRRLAAGETNAAVARAVGMSPQAVSQHLKRLRRADWQSAPDPRRRRPASKATRPCNSCGAPFQPTAERRMLCARCFQGDGGVDDFT